SAGYDRPRGRGEIKSVEDYRKHNTGEGVLIPRAYIDHWRSSAPWSSDAQVEQDLVIMRMFVMIFSDDELREGLAFRGGTALHKLYLAPAVRYSEDSGMRVRLVR
ncbi:MAG: nucleotidyl transferase AbiEii/AbiGii toxin family protein, partial [Bacteroidetes bacterium]|nr:nucleotidyl transferase AbiEii/AbiGii toxin family protein [Bacteroidota bacterium]